MYTKNVKKQSILRCLWFCLWCKVFSCGHQLWN